MASTSFATTAVAILSLVAQCWAQTFTDCNPMEQTDCKPDLALGIANYTIDFTKSMMSDTVWNATAGKVNYDDPGAEFTINARGDAPTVQTNFHIFFGQVEVVMKAAKGQGIVSSIVMESDDLDEVDWEWIGGNNSYVQTNYFGKGNTSSYDRAVWHPVNDPQDEWHNYTVDWTQDKLEWFIDGQSIRVLNAQDANGGHNFPQTPCDVRLGIWAGGDPKNPNGTVEWAGGETNYGNAPFTMTVKSVRVSDASRGTEYVWGDKSGSWQSIQVLNNTKPIKLDGENGGSSSQTLSQKWKGMAPTTKYIIIGVVGGVALLAIAVFAFCCIRQRRAGRHEKLIEDAKYEHNTAEVLAYRADMSRMRSDKPHQPQVYVNPVAGNTGAAYRDFSPSQPMMGAPSPNPSYGYGNSRVPSPNLSYGYGNSRAPSRVVNPYGSGNGYQRF